VMGNGRTFRLLLVLELSSIPSDNNDATQVLGTNVHFVT
jgi:hypothetical protein